MAEQEVKVWANLQELPCQSGKRWTCGCCAPSRNIKGSLHTKLLFIIALYLLTAQQQHARAGSVEKSVELPPISLNYNDFMQVLERFREAIIPARATEADIIGEKLTLAHNNINVSYELDPRRKVSEQVEPELKLITSVTYQYIYSSRRDARDPEITDAWIEFSDSRRRVAVAGSVHGRVESAISAIEDNLEDHHALVGGDTHRAIVKFLVAMTYFILFWGALFLLEKKGVIKPTFVAQLGLSIVSVLGLFWILFLPYWKAWLPGMEIEVKPGTDWGQVVEISLSVLGLLVSFLPFGIFRKKGDNTNVGPGSSSTPSSSTSQEAPSTDTKSDEAAIPPRRHEQRRQGKHRSKKRP